jgi:hypothetical protein
MLARIAFKIFLAVCLLSICGIVLFFDLGLDNTGTSRAAGYFRSFSPSTQGEYKERVQFARKDTWCAVAGHEAELTQGSQPVERPNRVLRVKKGTVVYVGDAAGLSSGMVMVRLPDGVFCSVIGTDLSEQRDEESAGQPNPVLNWLRNLAGRIQTPRREQPNEVLPPPAKPILSPGLNPAPHSILSPDKTSGTGSSPVPPVLNPALAPVPDSALSPGSNPIPGPILDTDGNPSAPTWPLMPPSKPTPARVPKPALK